VSGGGRDCFPEWMLLAELVLVMVPTSVEDECMFSTMKNLRHPQRNSLKHEHLTTCARGFKSKLSVGSVPYPEAIGAWLDACKVCGRYGLKRMVAVLDGPYDETFCGLASASLHLVARP